MSLILTGKTNVVGAVSDAATWRELAAGQQPLPCDLVELRVDALPDEAQRLPLSTPCPKPLLITPRHAGEGGARPAWDEAARRALAEELLPAAAALDWEIAQLEGAEELLRAARAQGVALIASAHYFHSMPSLATMRELESRAHEAGAAVVKIAFTPQSDADVERGLEFLTSCRMPAAIMGMGPVYGPRSRALYTAHGSVLLYGYLGSQPTAPGQMSAAECSALTARG
ncbi:MAG: type I 3-dehydroquinate dehydratase [Akkermansiaceae bacterium]|nr:type I 3-dehydroquinate dehydratase [Akkermansiaceae bacterium]